MKRFGLVKPMVTAAGILAWERKRLGERYLLAMLLSQVSVGNGRAREHRRQQ